MRAFGTDVVRLTALAAVVEGACVAVDVGVTGSLGMGAALVGMVVGISGGLSLSARRDRGWLTRDYLRRLAVGLGLGHFLLGGGVWVAVVGATGAKLFLGFGAIGLLVGLSAALVTMCAGDAVAMVYCPFADVSGRGSGDGPAGPWRRR